MPHDEFIQRDRSAHPPAYTSYLGDAGAAVDSVVARAFAISQ